MQRSKRMARRARGIGSLRLCKCVVFLETYEAVQAGLQRTRPGQRALGHFGARTIPRCDVRGDLYERGIEQVRHRSSGPARRSSSLR